MRGADQSQLARPCHTLPKPKSKSAPQPDATAQPESEPSSISSDTRCQRLGSFRSICDWGLSHTHVHTHIQTYVDDFLKVVSHTA